MTVSLHCPFTPRVSPHRDVLEAHNLAWLDRFGLLASPRARHKAQRARFGWLAARAYPDASFELLAIAAAWASWLFLCDDLCDEGGGQDDLEGRSSRFLAVLSGLAEPGADPLEAALADVRQRMLAMGGSAWMSRFLHDVQEYLEACAWEDKNRARGATPDLATYVRMRDLTGAVKTCFDVHELAEQLPIELRHDPIVSRMMVLANRIICWSNDIFSVDKERREDDCHNLVIVLERQGAPFDDALHAAGRMHDGLIDEFIALEAQLLSPEAREIVAALKGWIRANYDWSFETGRYRLSA